ncbi:MAG: signal peptide peptidase SppA [Prevotella sp.]|nr:signal peptide peptidase SppA [Prevotella sp.]
MKDFFKYVLATVVGLVLTSIIMFAFGAMSIVGMIASGEATKSIDHNSVLVLKLDGMMSEQSEDNFMNKINGIEGLSFENTMQAIQRAAANEDVAGIYIEAGQFGADLAQAEELHAELEKFRKTGKWIIAYGEDYNVLSYYLASTANKVYMNPQGTINWIGLGGEAMYIKNTLAKFGIKYVPVKVGKYKSAVERYTADEMSAADREQTERYLKGWWNTIVKGVSANRHISAADLNKYADDMIALGEPKQFVSTKMVDKLLYTDEVKPAVKKFMNLDEDDDINQISVDDILNTKIQEDGDEIAVYYAFGNIVNETSTEGMFNGTYIAAKDVCRDLQEIADDDHIKAVVLRINSGGGSAYASEQIWHQVKKLREKKPVVVSMSGAAASGGYYISAPANYIIADNTTITGSIGIYGLYRDMSELYTKKLGINFSQVGTNRNSVLGSQEYGFTPEQFTALQNNVNRGYELFKSRVAEGRKLTAAQVENIAQGRVWLGEDAKKIGLVDEIGGLNRAIAKAASLAKCKEYYAETWGETPSLLEQLLANSTDMDTYLDTKLKNTLGALYEPVMMMNEYEQMDKVQARMPYIIRIK